MKFEKIKADQKFTPVVIGVTHERIVIENRAEYRAIIDDLKNITKMAQDDIDISPYTIQFLEHISDNL